MVNAFTGLDLICPEEAFWHRFFEIEFLETFVPLVAENQKMAVWYAKIGFTLVFMATAFA